MTTTTATHYWSATAAATCGSVVVFAVEEEEEENNAQMKVPGFKLTTEERMKECERHKYGICVSCDAGLDDRADFTCDPRMPGGFALMCNACGDYYNKNG